MWWPISLPRRKPSLASAICGRELNALILDDDNQTLRLRFADNSAAVVNLYTRDFEMVSAHKYKEWLALPAGYASPMSSKMPARSS